MPLYSHSVLTHTRPHTCTRKETPDTHLHKKGANMYTQAHAQTNQPYHVTQSQFHTWHAPLRGKRNRIPRIPSGNLNFKLCPIFIPNANSAFPCSMYGLVWEVFKKAWMLPMKCFYFPEHANNRFIAIQNTR